MSQGPNYNHVSFEIELVLIKINKLDFVSFNNPLIVILLAYNIVVHLRNEKLQQQYITILKIGINKILKRSIETQK